MNSNRTITARDGVEENGDLLKGVMGRRSDLSSVPHGFVPFGEKLDVTGIDPGEIPQTTDELGELMVLAYDLTVKAAVDLNIPVIGTVGGGYNRRVVVYEWTRYKAVSDEDDVDHWYGYTIRFCLTVSEWNVDVGVSLPFLAAQAEMGQIQACWLMQVRGLTGAIDDVVLPPQDLDVETYVLAKQSLEAVIGAIKDPDTKFVPGVLLAKVDPATTETEYWYSAVRAFALHQISVGRTMAIARSRLRTTDPMAIDIVTSVYNYFEIKDPNAPIPSGDSAVARQLLGGIRADT